MANISMTRHKCQTGVNEWLITPACDVTEHRTEACEQLNNSISYVTNTKQSPVNS